MRAAACIGLLFGARGAAGAATATDTFTATLPTATETFTLPTTAATSTETYTLPTATFTLPTGGETVTHTFTLPTSTATYDNKTIAPTRSPTSPTSSPSGSQVPTASPSKAGDSLSPSMATLAPSKTGDTIAPTAPVVPTVSPSKAGDTIAPTAPITPTQSPSKAGDTSAPRSPTFSPSKAGDTNSPSRATVAPTMNPTHYPSVSPSRDGDTVSPTTAQPTSDTSNEVVRNNIQTKLVNVPQTFSYGGPGCTTKATNTASAVGDTNSFTLTIMSFVFTNLAGGASYVFNLNIAIPAALASDTEASSNSCPSGGFVAGFRSKITSTIVLSPEDRMPIDDITFSNTSTHRSNQVLASGANIYICQEVQGKVCVTKNPTKSPASNTPHPTGRHGEEGDDDFPGWAIALCVVLPVLAIGAAVAIYFFVCAKNNEEQNDDGNAPDAGEKADADQV